MVRWQSRQDRSVGFQRQGLALLASVVVGTLVVAATTSAALASASSPSAPVVASVSPAYGPASGGTSVKVNGENFAGATAVKFGSSDAASFEVNSETEITAVSPAGEGIPDVRVTTPEGTSATSPADEFSYAPVVTKVEPNDGVEAGGTAVTIAGGNFTGATAVKFGLHDAESFTVNSDSSITAVSPFLNGEGIVDVTVIGPGGTSATGSQDRFGYGPVIEMLTPRQGPATGGTVVTITGFGLERAGEVDFGSQPAASFTVNPGGSVTALAPPFAGGSAAVPVTVTTPTGSSIASPRDPGLLPANYFSYGPTVTKVEPDQGPAAGGTTVVIHGTGFSSARRTDELPFVRAVYFGSTELTCESPRSYWLVPCAPVEFEVDSETEITAVAPPGTGQVDVAVETSGGTSPISPADQFTYDAPVHEGSSGTPKAKILSNQAVVNGHRRIKLLIRCQAEPGSACSGSIGLTGIPGGRGAGRLRSYGGRGRFMLAAGSRRQIHVDILPWAVAWLKQVHRRPVRASIRLRFGQPSAKDLVLRWEPAAGRAR